MSIIDNLTLVQMKWIPDFLKELTPKMQLVYAVLPYLESIYSVYKGLEWALYDSMKHPAFDLENILVLLVVY